jgi:hypothetical protein
MWAAFYWLRLNFSSGLFEPGSEFHIDKPGTLLAYALLAEQQRSFLIPANE